VSFNVAAQALAQPDLDHALQQLEKTISMDPNNALAYELVDAIYLQKKMPAQAFTAHEKAKSLEGEFDQGEMAEMRAAYQAGGIPAYYRKENDFRLKRIAEGKYQSPLFIALGYAVAGDDLAALDWLEKAVEERASWLPELKMDPAWDALRSQPRFIAVLKKIGLEK